jgi:hypothetical protein
VARFLVETDFGPITEDDMQEFAARAAVLEAKHFPDVHWEGSRVCTQPDGSIRAFCVYEAPGAERLQEHTDVVRENLLTRIYEIVGEIDPEGLKA